MTTNPPSPRKAALIVNAQSRKGQALFRDARAKLEARGIELVAAHAITDPKTLIPTMRETVKSGVPMIIVGGGDGSLSCTVDEAVEEPVVFALLPLGTANSFARTLGIPIDLDAAIDVIVTGERRRIDLGMIDGDYFANCAALGLSPMIGDSVPHKLKRYLGRAGYLIWAIWCLIRFRSFKAIITDGEQEHRVRATELRIANGRFHGGVELIEEACLNSGEIVVQAVTGHAKMRLVWNWFASYFKLPSRREKVVSFSGRELKVRTIPPLKVSIDGEVLARTPVTARAAERAIEVMVPRAGMLPA